VQHLGARKRITTGCIMSDIFAALETLYSPEEIEQEVAFIRSCGFVREPENAGAPVEKLHEALESLANEYTREHD
jgi:hypothetical protein